MFAKPCYNKRFFISKIWNYLKNTYLCIVFFIVLDLRLTKDWLSGKIAFFIFSLPSPPNSVTAKNATKWKRQKQRRITCKNRGSITGQCFSHIKDQELFKKDNRLLKKEKELLPKRLDLFYRCQDFVSHYSMEVQTPYAHFLREKSLKTPYFLSSLE